MPRSGADFMNAQSPELCKLTLKRLQSFKNVSFKLDIMRIQSVDMATHLDLCCSET